MCLIALHWSPNSPCPLQVVANRDEFHARPAAALAWWDDAPDVLAGRDLQAGGTWMGVNRYGGFAALTNYRQPGATESSRSRGEIVANYLKNPPQKDLEAYLRNLPLDDYAGFNLLIGDRERLFYVSNRDANTPRPVAPGTHGLSNALLDTPWPKVEAVRSGLERLATGPQQQPESAMALMQRRQTFADEQLPDTGVGLSMERLLSPPFICTPAYGTRNTTWLSLGQEQAQMIERRYTPDGQLSGESRELFELVSAT